MQPSPRRTESQYSNPIPTLPRDDLHLQDDGEDSGPVKRGIAAADRIRAVISRKDIHTAYVALFVLTLSISFTSYTTGTFGPYATSAFKLHSRLATAGVVSRVFAMVAYALVSKVTDNCGRISPSVFMSFILLGAIGDALMAGCKNVNTYIGANVFGGLSNTAQEMAVQIYIADTTSLVSRAFWNVLADGISNIITLYSGSEIGGKILANWGTTYGWRWGYGMWAIINVVMAIPFIAILWSWHLRADRDPAVPSLPPLLPHDEEFEGSLVASGVQKGSVSHGFHRFVHYLRTIFFEQLYHDYDIVGCFLLIGGVALILVPLTLARGIASAWDKENVAMICCGFGIILLFVAWSMPARYRPSWAPVPRYPLIPWHTLKNRSVMAMFIINMFDFMSYATFTIYFTTYLQVAAGVTPSQASQIDNTLRIVFQVTAIGLGLCMRFWTDLCRRFGLGDRLFHTRYPVWIGIPLCAIGIAIDIDFVQHPRRGSAVASFVVAKLIYGIGRGLFQTSSQVAIQAAAKRNDLAIATGIFYFAMSLGGAIGTAIAGATWNNTLPQALTRNLPADAGVTAMEIFRDIKVAMKYDPSTDVGLAIQHSYAHTQKILAIIATCLQIPMLISMLFVTDVALTPDEQVTEGGKRIAMNKKRESESSGEHKDQAAAAEERKQ